MEFAFVLPLLMLALVGLTELGRAFYQAHVIEKGLRAGTLYAARRDAAMGATTRAQVENLIRTGTADGSGPLLTSAWEAAESAIAITTRNFTVDEETEVIVIRVSATVPFDPLLPGLLPLFGPSAFTMNLSHEQAFLGD